MQRKKLLRVAARATAATAGCRQPPAITTGILDLHFVCLMRASLCLLHDSNPCGFIDCQRQLSAHIASRSRRALPAEHAAAASSDRRSRRRRRRRGARRRGTGSPRRSRARRRAPPPARCSRGRCRGWRERARLLEQMPQRRHVALGKIDDVDVVAHAGAVGRVVVAADAPADVGASTDGDLRDVGHQVVRHAARVLADQSALVRADRVEVAQAGDAPRRIAALELAQQQSRRSAWYCRTG